MNLRDFQYVEALASTLHFGEAAKRCHVSQSTLSIQIKKLEEKLGASLFERDARSVRLSEAGQQLLPAIVRALRAADEVTLTAEQLHDPLAGTVRFGAFPTLAPYALPYIMPRLGKVLPRLKLELIEEKTENLIALPVTHPRLDAIALFAEPFLLAVSQGSALAKKKSASVEDLRKSTLLLL